MEKDQKKRRKALEKELKAVQNQEKKLQKNFERAKPAAWKTALDGKIPQKVYFGLESTFSKGFSLVFNQGRSLIEKSYNKEKIQADHSIRDYAVQVKGGRKELKQIHKNAKRKDGVNMVVTTAEGIALGALGIGMPDIVLFISTLLKGIYETALNYGYDYESRDEQYRILKMMAASLNCGETWWETNAEVEELMLLENLMVTEEELNEQIRQTASVFAMDMLLLKFIQGLPIVGVLGGLGNPIYYNRVLNYVQLKYRKRYLQKQLENFEMENALD